MSKATEDNLNVLHNAVATVLTEQIQHREAEVIFDAGGEEVETGKEVYSATPATVAAAIKFLKDNSITCEVSTSKNMSNLRDTLAKKQRHSRKEDAKVAALRLVGDE